jgi:hypothetical protein
MQDCNAEPVIRALHFNQFPFCNFVQNSIGKRKRGATGIPLESELSDQPALVALVASLRDVRYSVLRRALVPVRDEMGARDAFLEVFSN